MASWLDLQKRAEALGAGATYVSTPSHWLLAIVRDARDAPQIVNVKGVAAEHTVIVTTLAEYEDLHRRAAVNANDR